MPKIDDSCRLLGLMSCTAKNQRFEHGSSDHFGMTGTPVAIYLRFGQRILIRILKDEPDARISIPGIEKICEYQAAINERHPNLENVWCCMVGLKLYLEEAGDATMQNN